jgi:hypothetical protein
VEASLRRYGTVRRCVQSVPKSIEELKANTEAAQEAVREAEKAVEDAKKSRKALHAPAPLDESQADLDDKRSALAWLAGLMSVAQQPAKEWREVTHHFEYLKLQLHEHYASLTADQPIVRESRRCATCRTVAALHVPSIPWTLCSGQHETDGVHHAACNVQQKTCSGQHPASNLQQATRKITMPSTLPFQQPLRVLNPT